MHRAVKKLNPNIIYESVSTGGSQHNPVWKLIPTVNNISNIHSRNYDHKYAYKTEKESTNCKTAMQDNDHRKILLAYGGQKGQSQRYW